MSPLTIQYKSFFRDIKPHRDVCLIVEYTVLSLLLVFFLGFLYCPFLNFILCLFSVPSIISLFFFPPVLNHPVTDLTPITALSAHCLKN